MIDRIEIKAFKSVEDATIELGKINVFIGANGSGKSNILEAVGVLGAAAAGRVDDETLLRRGVRPGVPALYKASFREKRLRDAIRFAAFSNTASYEVELNNPIRAPKPAWRFKTEQFIAEGVKVVGRSPRSREYQSLDHERGLAALRLVELLPDSPGSVLLQTLRDYAIFSPNTASLRGTDSDPQTRSPVGLSGGRIAEAVSELKRQAVDDEQAGDVLESVLDLVDWVDGFGAKDSSTVHLSPSIPRQRQILYFRDRFMAEGRNELSAYDASEGALYILFAAVVAMHHSSPTMCAVDNFDAALNPRLARTLMSQLSSWVVDTERQLLLTCHNPLVLDGLDIQDDRVRLFAVDRSSRGVTRVQRVVVSQELLEKAKDGWPLSRLWVTGHIGGVPNV